MVFSDDNDLGALIEDACQSQHSGGEALNKLLADGGTGGEMCAGMIWSSLPSKVQSITCFDKAWFSTLAWCQYWVARALSPDGTNAEADVHQADHVLSPIDPVPTQKPDTPSGD
jgi:hypothetical protein